MYKSTSTKMMQGSVKCTYAEHKTDKKKSNQIWLHSSINNYVQFVCIHSGTCTILGLSSLSF